MNPLKEVFESGQTILWIETQNTVAFLRPVPDVLVWTPCPTACVAESLRLRQIGFALPHRFFRTLLVELGLLAFLDIEVDSNPIQERSVVRPQGFDAAQEPAV